jgi:uncharacterized membrane protein YidH (DUF202 family)
MKRDLFFVLSPMMNPGPSRTTTRSEVATAINESAPLNTGAPLISSYVITPTGRGRRIDRQTTPSLSPKMTKEGDSGHRNPRNGAIGQSAETSTDNVTEGSGGCRTRHSSGFDTLRSKVTLTLKNSGSVARDHLASERTFLAYMRTSLAIAAAGIGTQKKKKTIPDFFSPWIIAFIQLFTSASGRVGTKTFERIHPAIRTLGASAIALGLIVAIIGRYLPDGSS